jgi:hypothetical protein
MRALISLSVAAALAVASFAVPAHAGKSAAYGAPGGNSTAVETVTIVVFPDGSVTVNGSTVNPATLPPQLLTILNQYAAAGGGSFTLQTANPLILGMLASYF